MLDMYQCKRQITPPPNSLCCAGNGTPPKGDVFGLPNYQLSITPRRGSVLAFQASRVKHVTRVAEEPGKGCDTLRTSLAIHHTGIKAAIAHHKACKKQQDSIQLEKEEIVKTRHALGIDRFGAALIKYCFDERVPCVSPLQILAVRLALPKEQTWHKMSKPLTALSLVSLSPLLLTERSLT